MENIPATVLLAKCGKVPGLAGRVLAVTNVTTKSKDSNRKKAGVVK
jgi:hypothetical protein